MLDYIGQIQKAFINQLGFEEDPSQQGLPLSVPNGTYPVQINGKWDLVRITGGKINCAQFDQFIPAQLGYYRRDDAGLWHYITTQSGGIRRTFTPDAIEHRPKNAAAIFWFNDFPAPIHLKDKPDTLAQRSSEWFEGLCSSGTFFEAQLKTIKVTRLPHKQ